MNDFLLETSSVLYLPRFKSLMERHNATLHSPNSSKLVVVLDALVQLMHQEKLQRKQVDVFFLWTRA